MRRSRKISARRPSFGNRRLIWGAWRQSSPSSRTGLKRSWFTVLASKSFSVALNALRRAKIIWTHRHKTVYSFYPQLAIAIARRRLRSCFGLFRADNRLENRDEVLAPLERLGKPPVRVEPLLAPWRVNKRQLLAHPPKLEDRVDEHVCRRHEYSASALACIKIQEQQAGKFRKSRPWITRCHTQAPDGNSLAGRPGGTEGNSPARRQDTAPEVNSPAGRQDTMEYARTTGCAWNLTLVLWRENVLLA